MITALALTLLCADPEVAPPTSAPPLPAAAPAPANAPVVESFPDTPEVRTFSQFVDRNLLAIDYNVSGFTPFKVRQRERTASLFDEDFSTLFRLVPEAEAVAQRAHEGFRTSFIFQIAGLTVTLGALIPMMFVAAVPGAILPLFITAGVLLVGGLILTLIGGPMATNAMTDMFSAVAMHNRGLLERRAIPVGAGASVDAAFRDGLAYALPR